MAKKGKDFELPATLFDAGFWEHFKAVAINLYRHHTFDKGNPKDVYDRKFKPYSTGYKISKGSGKLRRQDSSYSDSVAPVVSGDLMLDTNASSAPQENAIYIGWTTHAYKVDILREKGRVLTDTNKAMPDSVMKKLMPEFNKHLKKVMPKGSQTIIIGKK